MGARVCLKCFLGIGIHALGIGFTDCKMGMELEFKQNKL